MTKTIVSHHGNPISFLAHFAIEIYCLLHEGGFCAMKSVTFVQFHARGLDNNLENVCQSILKGNNEHFNQPLELQSHFTACQSGRSPRTQTGRSN